jgi:hypothetical protein
MHGLPNCLFIGPHRTGTTWIHRYLEWRGDVGLPDSVKEVWFFDRYYDRGSAWYERQFKVEDSHRTVVEVGPGYFACEPAPQRVLETLGAIPVIVTLRHPVEQVFSSYKNMRAYGMTRQNLRETIEEYPSLLSAARYAVHIDRWRQALGQDRVHFLLLETLREEPNDWAVKICDILGLDYREVPADLRRSPNASTRAPSHYRLARYGWRTSRYLRSLGLHRIVESAKRAGLRHVIFGRPGTGPVPTLTDDDRQWLLDELVPDVVRLETMLGLDLDAWKA